MSGLKSAASSYGSFTGYGTAAVFIILSMCLCGWGGYTVQHPDVAHTATASATLTDVKCQDKQCSFTATYTVNTKAYNLNGSLPGPLKNGETIPIYYNPSNPADAQANSVLSGKSGGFMIAGGFVSFICGCLIAYFINQASNNTRAVIGGASLLSSLFSHRN